MTGVEDVLMATRSRSSRGARRNGRNALQRGTAGSILVFDIGRYGGKWVATRGHDVVAEGQTYTEVKETVVALGLQDDVILTLVPRTGAFAY